MLTSTTRLATAATLLSAALASASVVPLNERADGVTPTAPGPGDVFRQGSQCTTEWTPDTSGKWTNFTIDREHPRILPTRKTAFD